MNTRTLITLALGASALMLTTLPSHAEGDAKRGAAVFATQCSECHSIKEGKDRKGPSLFAVMGRKAAQNSSFVYSDAMKQSGIVWTPDRLQAYLANPKKAVPGGKMKFDGLDNASEMADLLSYLSSIR
jgi:cytochrome c